MMRLVTLLCLLAVVSAMRLATNLPCLPYKENEAFLDLRGCDATALPQYRESPGWADAGCPGAGLSRSVTACHRLDREAQ